MKAQHAILTLCRHLEVSASGYYDWQRRRTAPGPRALANQTLTQEIQAIHGRSRQTYGSPRILVELHKQGHGCGRNRVARIMRETGLCGRQKGRYRVRTTDSNHAEPIAPNRLATAPKAIRLRSTLHPPPGSGNFAFRISRTRGFSRQFIYLELKAHFLTF
jgi:hypothetical protein